MPIHKYLILFIFLYAIGMASVHADDAALEQRVQNLAKELRCLVCQNQSLADSHADLAIDLKNQVREKFKQGASEADVIQFMSDRYGDFVLYRPPLKWSTVVLWFGPGVLLLAALVALFMRLRRRAADAEPTLSAAERARAAALLNSSEPERR